MAEDNTDDLDIDDLLNDDDDTPAPAPAKAPAAPKAPRAPRSKPNFKPAATEPVPDADDLLADEAPADGITPEEAAQIAALEAQLRAPSPFVAVEETLSPAQIRIRDLQEELAAKQVAELDSAPTAFDEIHEGAETILLHFLTDGFIACGKTWYRGQELEFEIGSRAYEEQFDRNGTSWLNLVDDIDAQYDRWGEQKFAAGPWRGRSWEEAPMPADLPAEEHAAYRAGLRAAAEAEKKRGRKAPLLPVR